MKRIVITNFTDPACVWCWGTEPAFRALETHYPNQVEFRYIAGGLVDDIDNFADLGNGIEGGSDSANKQIMSHWLEAGDRHGMPIKEEGFHLFSKEYPSTYPQNIAYKAAQIADAEKSDAFLRRMREATLTEAKVTSNPDIQIELASEVGIDISAFIKAMRSGEAEKKFKADMAITQSIGVRGFPSFLVKTSEGRQVLVRGYKSLEEFKEIITYLTDGSLVATEVIKSFEALDELLANHPKLAIEEVRQAFDFPNQKGAEEWIEKFVLDGRITKEAAGTSYFIRKGNTLACNMTRGTCQ